MQNRAGMPFNQSSETGTHTPTTTTFCALPRSSDQPQAHNVVLAGRTRNFATHVAWQMQFFPNGKTLIPSLEIKRLVVWWPQCVVCSNKNFDKMRVGLASRWCASNGKETVPEWLWQEFGASCQDTESKLNWKMPHCPSDLLEQDLCM